MKHAVFAFVLAATFGSTAVADPTLECSASAGSQVEIGNCLAAVEKNVDAALATAFDIAMASARELDDVTGRAVAVPAFEAAEAAWAPYRDAQCAAVGAGFGGGSGTGIAIQACRIELGRARIAALLNLAN